jgi:hypothetical protein
MKMTPAQYVIHKFGGVRQLARLLKKSPSAVSRWPKPSSINGRDGRIPYTEQKRILQIARERGIDVTAEDILLGREVEVEPAIV